MTPKKARKSIVAAGLAFGSAIMLSGGILLSQTFPDRTLIYVTPAEAPIGMAVEDLAGPVSPMLVRDTTLIADAAFYAALDRTYQQVPPAPWGNAGLANIEIDPDDITYDENRGRYVVSLEDGSVAILTLDRGIQSHMETTLSRYNEPAEASVALDPATGRVLALVDDYSSSHPIGSGLATRSFAYSASTFKVMTGAALLETGEVLPDTRTCYYGGGNGFDLSSIIPDSTRDTTCVTLTGAIARSANIVMGRLADQHLTTESLQNMADRFAYNTMIPFEIPVQRSVASIPEDRLEFARSAAGFRHTWASPLHSAMMQGTIANNGIMMVPTLVDSIEDSDGNVTYEHTPVVWRQVLSPEIAQLTRQTLSETAISGTARNYFRNREGFPSNITVFGKTGTLSNRGMHGANPDPYYIFSWFAGFAEKEDELIAVAGLVVSSPQWWIKGSYVAAETVLSGLR